jgi:pyruvate-formate lyase-activating enzyme
MVAACKKPLRLLYCTPQGQNLVKAKLDDRYQYLARSAYRAVEVKKKDLIPLPYGSMYVVLPQRDLLYKNPAGINKAWKNHWAVGTFLSSGYLRTLLPAYIPNPRAPKLSLWAYTACAEINGKPYAAAVRIDDDPRSDPQIHENDDELLEAIAEIVDRFPDNRLVRQLAYCATEYRCLCARNFFLGRYEAPIPSSPVCNAHCLGCLSQQDKARGLEASQHRLTFAPTPEEMAQVMSWHLGRVKGGIVSFGQGCEGEPLMRGKDLAQAIRLTRGRTARGTINLNTNGSLPLMAQAMIKAGLDAMRVSFNSLVPENYYRYFLGKSAVRCTAHSYKIDDVFRTIQVALDAGIKVAINLFVLPGVTDTPQERDALFNFLEKYPIAMIQTRNLNIDPDDYLSWMQSPDVPAFGIKNWLAELHATFPKVRLGYYNPAWKK